MRCYVFMGVSGCGKTSVGQAVSDRCGMQFVDGDDLHPRSNIDKMASGTPLTDEDRAPWLEVIGHTLATTPGPVAIGCSALKRRYRDTIRGGAAEPVVFVHLDAAEPVLAARVNDRNGHFMPPALLRSQFEALEHLGEDELGTRIDIAQPFAQVVDGAETYIRETLK
jgi:carbohydrate kinase (thermoresistant glucokinase family)